MDSATILSRSDSSSAPALEPGPEVSQALRRPWRRLEEMGFELALKQDSLEVRHRDASFEMVIQLSHPDDLGERRALFRELKSAFGRPTDRFFSWLLQPSAAVLRPYESLKELLSACEQTRETRRAR